eukprot:COSAG03_NODE_16303_length_405_cov_1018.977124_1_plen_39_part_01
MLPRHSTRLVLLAVLAVQGSWTGGAYAQQQQTQGQLRGS